MAIPKLAMIPSGYKANKVYSVLPTDGSGDLVTARTTTATRVNQNGLIEEVAIGVPRLDYTDGGCPSLLLEPSSTNLITQSESFGNSYWNKSGASIEGDASTAGVEKVVNGDFATDTNWTKGANTTISGGKLINSNSGAYSATTQSLALSVGTYLITYTIDSISNGSVVLGVTGLDLPSKNTSGTYSQQITLSSASTLLNIYSTTAGTVFTLDNVSIKEVSGFSAPSVDSPLSAFKLVATTNDPYIFKTNLNVTANTHTASVYVKGVGSSIGKEGRFLFWYIGTAVGTTISVPFTLTSEWQRVQGSTTPTSGGTIALRIDLPNVSVVGDEVLIFGSQLEAQSSATSYIKTSGTTISRTADSASKSGISSLIGQTEGTIFLDTVISTDIDGLSRISLSQGTSTSDWIFFSAPEVAGGLMRSRIFINNGNIGQVDIYGGYLASGRHKFALAYKENDVVLYVDGVLDLSDNSALIPSTDTVSLNGSSPSSVNAGRTSKHSDFRLYNTRLSNSELQILTTI